MDIEQHNRLRARVRDIIRQRTAGSSEGGFLPLATLIPAIDSALPSLIDAGKRLFSGSGKHHSEAKTRKPNARALKVKQYMLDHLGTPLPVASAAVSNKKHKVPKKVAKKAKKHIYVA